MAEQPLQRTARVAGVLYLIVIVCAGFAEGDVRTGLIVPSDAAATADNIASSAGLYRVGFASLNLLNHFMALLLVREGANGAGLATEQVQTLASLFVEAHGIGYLIGGAFFGVHLLLLGYLIYQSTYLPRWLGILLALAAAGYLVESFGTFLVPRYEAVYVWVVAVPAAVAEVSLALWLTVKGVRTDRLAR